MQGWYGSWRRFAAAGLLAIACAIPALLSAHEIPNDVTIQSFIRADGSELKLLVRVPLIAMRDMTWRFKGQDIIDLERSAQALHDASTLWVGDDVTVYEDGRKLGPQTVAAVRATPAEDRSFENYDSALALLTAPQTDADVTVATGYLDLLFTYPIQSASSRFSIEPKWGRLGLRAVTVMRLILGDGTVRAFEVTGNPGVVDLDPRWIQAAWRFVKLGFEHILDGTDHLLFLFCLVIPFRRFRSLITIVTAFTVAHSITLIASAYDLGPDALWFPPLIEMLIATSIVYMALENIVGASLHRRWLITFGFGLVHGFGFSFALKQTLQFAGSHLLTSLLSFNVGVELGQLLVLLLLLPALDFLFSRVVQERMGTIILSALVAHTGWHWMTERYGVFSQYPVTMPEFTPAFIAELLRYAMALVALAGILWAISAFTKSRDDAEATS
ncbi:MAG: HupE/UreJ family protein [Acidobacteria bacterium]|nr:HupE/UreJ family protein [Acidobacteriota bacterium]